MKFVKLYKIVTHFGSILCLNLHFTTA